MSRFPFVTAEEVRQARSRYRAVTPPDDACRRLDRSVEAVLTEATFAAPLAERTSHNLFVVQGILFEASLAFRLSGDERHAQPVRRLLAELADASCRRSRLPGELHLGFVLVGLAVAAHLCGEALDQDLVIRVATAIGEELWDSSTREAWGQRTPRRLAWNHTAIPYAALGCAGLLCRGEPQAERWIGAAVDRMRGYFANGVTDAGMTREGLHYAGFVFRNAAPFLLACRHTGVFDFRDPAQNPHLERLRRVPRWYALEVFPRGSWVQNLNDSAWDPRRALWGFLPVFGPFDPALTGWVHRRLVGAEGDQSQGQDLGLRASALFETVLWPPTEDAPSAGLPTVLADPDVGYLAERVRQPPCSGFSMNCGPFFGSIHDQSDNGSVTLFAHDVPLLIDCGAANDPTEGSASSSHGHNLTLIDGRGQFPSGAGTGVSGALVRVTRSPVATVVTADLAASYRRRGYHDLAHAVRHCVYGKAPFPYLLIVDDFARLGQAPAVFDQLFHTPPASDVRIGDGELDLLLTFDGASSRMLLRAVDRATVREHRQTLLCIPWREHPVWTLRRTGGHTVMAALVLPYQSDDQRPEASRPEIEAELDADTGRVSLRWHHRAARGLDVLTFVPATAAPAAFTRDGLPPQSAEILLQRRFPSTALPSARPLALAGGSQALPERLHQWMRYCRTAVRRTTDARPRTRS